METTVDPRHGLEDDLILEDTFDWYAQDDAGNVWYSARSCQLRIRRRGRLHRHQRRGPWSSDDPGNAPGWHTKAQPELGPAYYLEYAPGIAEDESIIVATGLSVDTPLRALRRVVQDHRQLRALRRASSSSSTRPASARSPSRRFAADGSTTTVVDLYRQRRPRRRPTPTTVTTAPERSRACARARRSRTSPRCATSRRRTSPGRARRSMSA